MFYIRKRSQLFWKLLINLGVQNDIKLRPDVKSDGFFFMHMSSQKGRKIVVNGFKKAGIRDVFDQASKLRELADSPFIELDIECDL